MLPQTSCGTMLTLVAAALVLGVSRDHCPAAFLQSPSLVARPSARGETGLMAATMEKKGYVPKWKKKETLADGSGDLSAADVGLIGTIPVLFKQGNETRSTMAIVGQPVSDVAAQAGQFIKYGCKKGECGTCEAMCNGKWIRPCTAAVPALPQGEEYVIQVKEIKAKAASSGTFFSVRSFFMGFYNNLLGMVGFVKRRRAARQNYLERMEYEETIQKLTLEKKKKRAEEKATAKELRP